MICRGFNKVIVLSLWGETHSRFMMRYSWRRKEDKLNWDISCKRRDFIYFYKKCLYNLLKILRLSLWSARFWCKDYCIPKEFYICIWNVCIKENMPFWRLWKLFIFFNLKKIFWISLKKFFWRNSPKK